MSNKSVVVACRRHLNQFPPDQFVALAVIGHRQQVGGGKRLGYGGGNSHCRVSVGLATHPNSITATRLANTYATIRVPSLLSIAVKNRPQTLIDKNISSLIPSPCRVRISNPVISISIQPLYLTAASKRPPASLP